MSTIFKQLETTTHRFQEILGQYTLVDEGHRFSWPNFVYTDSTFRRAHLDVVDARSTKKLYMLHLTVMPHISDPAPVFGFDLIAGPTKVTGAFHDFSPVGAEHPLSGWFAARVSQYAWSKPRQLPAWAQEIFSPSMVAAGNISDLQELSAVLELAVSNLEHYLQEVGNVTARNFTAEQNKYCRNQKQNPHTPKVMEALGLDPAEVETFIHTCLFPELP